MRSIFSFCLLALIGLVCCTHHALAQRRQQQSQQREFPPPPSFWAPAPPVQPPPAKSGQRVVVSSPVSHKASAPANKTLKLFVEGGLQTDEKKAYENALEVAREELKSQLRGIKPDFRWERRPSLRELDQFVVSKDTRPPEALDKEDLKDLGKKVYRTRLTLEIPEFAQEQMLKDVRMEEAGDRQLYLSRWMLAVVVVLMVFAAYFRFDDATKGYYTRWLKLVALGLLIAVGAGLFMLS